MAGQVALWGHFKLVLFLLSWRRIQVHAPVVREAELTLHLHTHGQVGKQVSIPLRTSPEEYSEGLDNHNRTQRGERGETNPQ